MVKRVILSSHNEWLDSRKNRIGGSDASAVLGMNPYKSNVDLWLEKRGKIETKDISDKPYVQYGTNAEYHLRELFKLDFPQYKVEYYKNNMFLNDKYPFAHASLDGELTDENGRKGILEIKTTNILQSMQKEKWKDKIPDNYYIQILHYLMVTEYEFVILKAQLKSEFDENVYLQTKHYFIEREEVLEDIKYLIEEEIKFYALLKKGIRPNLILPEI